MIEDRDHVNAFGHRQPLRPERDSQRRKLYKAEEVMKEHAAAYQRLETVEEIYRYIANVVLRSSALRNRYERELRREIKVGDGRRRRRAGGDVQGIYMPKWSRHVIWVLHEIAHTIQMRRHGYCVSSHGREFCAIYLDLVRFCVGGDAYDKLKASFIEHRVKFKAKRRVTMSEEQKEAMRGRMQIARASLSVGSISLKITVED